MFSIENKKNPVSFEGTLVGLFHIFLGKKNPPENELYWLNLSRMSEWSHEVPPIYHRNSSALVLNMFVCTKSLFREKCVRSFCFPFLFAIGDRLILKIWQSSFSKSTFIPSKKEHLHIPFGRHFPHCAAFWRTYPALVNQCKLFKNATQLENAYGNGMWQRGLTRF